MEREEVPDTKKGERSNVELIRSDGNVNANTLNNWIRNYEDKVAKIEKQLKAPWYKDKRFWAGVTTIPIIFGGGWVLKLATDRPFALREIHRLLGTEPALIAALDEKDSAFKKSIQATAPGRATLLTTMFRLGLLQERAPRLACQPNISVASNAKFNCEIPQGAFVSVADAPFSSKETSKVYIEVVINVSQSKFREDGSLEIQEDKTGKFDPNGLIRLSLNGKDLSFTKKNRWSTTISTQGADLNFVRYRFLNVDLGEPDVPDFPLNMLSVSVAKDLNQYHSVTVGIMVSDSKNSLKTSAEMP